MRLGTIRWVALACVAALAVGTLLPVAGPVVQYNRPLGELERQQDQLAELEKQRNVLQTDLDDLALVSKAREKAAQEKGPPPDPRSEEKAAEAKRAAQQQEKAAVAKRAELKAIENEVAEARQRFESTLQKAVEADQRARGVPARGVPVAVWQFILGVIGALAPQLLKAYQARIAGTTLPTTTLSYWLLTLAYGVFGGVFAVSWGDEQPFKSLWVGLSLPVIVSTFGAVAPTGGPARA